MAHKLSSFRKERLKDFFSKRVSGANLAALLPIQPNLQDMCIRTILEEKNMNVLLEAPYPSQCKTSHLHPPTL